MLDETYMRQWNDHHMAVTQGVDRLIARIGGFFGQRRVTIGAAYVAPANDRPVLQASQTTKALLSGLAAVVITAVIFTGAIATVTAAQPLLAGPVHTETSAPELA